MVADTKQVLKIIIPEENRDAEQILKSPSKKKLIKKSPRSFESGA